jgi:DNA-binding GntR family transcriptional regulator
MMQTFNRTPIREALSLLEQEGFILAALHASGADIAISARSMASTLIVETRFALCLPAV